MLVRGVQPPACSDGIRLTISWYLAMIMNFSAVQYIFDCGSFIPKYNDFLSLHRFLLCSKWLWCLSTDLFGFG